jgi:hypothetical protein
MDSKTIGVLGGTGPAGSAVAVRIAAAGYTVLLGSRETTKAQAKVDELHARFPGRLGGLRGVDNATAAATDIAILATVADSIIPTATEHAAALAGRVVVCMANLLQKTPRGFAAVFPAEGSVAEAVQGRRADRIGDRCIPKFARQQPLGDLDSAIARRCHGHRRRQGRGAHGHRSDRWHRRTRADRRRPALQQRLRRRSHGHLDQRQPRAARANTRCCSRRCTDAVSNATNKGPLDGIRIIELAGLGALPVRLAQARGHGREASCASSA